MLKTNVLNNVIAFDAVGSANRNSTIVNEGHDTKIISLSQYRDRIKSRISIDKNPDKNPLPPCAFSQAA